MTAKNILAVAMGDAVPPWLLECIPAGPQSRFEHFRFAVDALIIDAPECYVVISTGFGPQGPILDTTGTYGCRISAASKPVRVVNVQEVHFASEVDAAALRAHYWPEQAIQVADPHPGFWQRLWYAVSGR